MLRTTNAAGRIRDESLMNLGGRDFYKTAASPDGLRWVRFQKNVENA
jgi:hypothetical protein